MKETKPFLPGVRSCTVKCSCGKESVITWSDSLQQFVCQSPGWKFRTRKGPGDGPIGWFCGEPGHHQADYTRITDIEMEK